MFRGVLWRALCLVIPLHAIEPAHGESSAAYSTKDLKAAVAKAIPLLLKGARGHIEQRTCFACHNQALPTVALTAAAGRGFPGHAEELEKHLDFITGFLEQNRASFRAGRGTGGQVDTAGYALLTLELGGRKPSDVTDAVIEYLLLRDKDLDHWRTTSNRPPSEASQFTPNYLALRALRYWGRGKLQDRIARRIQTVKSWLLATQAKDTEDHVFRLRALVAAGAGDADRQAAAKALSGLQQRDGGWSQTTGMKSDPYATGSALVALHEVGGMPSSDPAIQRGAAFLLRSQLPDGSWHVVSRSHPFQTYFESGFPHGKDQFISMAASGWAVAALALALPPGTRKSIPDKLVVLTFDDSCKSHYTVVRPLLKKLGFGATFFITEGFDFPTNKRDYMTWDEIAALHREGFEIGNHTRDHMVVKPETVKDLAAQIRGINARCREHGIPEPVSFAYPGNGIDMAALPVLRELGIVFARRGGSPEFSYKDGRGVAFEPGLDHPLLIPSAGDARPAWTKDDFRQAVEQARGGRIAVLQFHGVPDTAHAWVNTSPGQFESYMRYLAEHQYKVIAMRDLARYVDPDIAPSNPQEIIDKRKARAAGPHQLVVRGTAAGGYAAFPDVCRTPNGDLLCVFYSGYGHVSAPSKNWPRGGRIMAVRSADEGKSWSQPFVIADTVHDDRDPHVAALSNSTLVCNWFAAAAPDKPLPGNRRIAIFLARSMDNGKTWTEPAELSIDSADWFASSAPIRELPDGTWILGLYTEDTAKDRVFGATIKSYDRGKSWKDLATIGEKSGLYLDAETDVVRLGDGTLLAALRSSKTDLYFANSTDAGKSWSTVRSSGFKGHCPHFLRHSNGVILLSHRIPATALHWSSDEGKSWQGPLQLDSVGGAYPSCVELAGGAVYCVYYEEGAGSSIRGVRLKVRRSGVSIDQPD